MKLALVNNGVVENVIVPPDGEWEAPDGVLLVECDDELYVGPGFTYDGKEFEPPKAAVPQSVTPLQIRKALRQVGLKIKVDAMVASLPEEVAEEWEYATTIERQNPLLLNAMQGLGLSEEDGDNLFRLAASL